MAVPPSPGASPTECDASAPSEHVDLRHIEQVIEIVRCGGFSGAARRLNLTQPALSKSIARLEATLNVRLFDRTRVGARATEHGRLLADRGRVLLEGATELRRELTAPEGRAHRLRIGVGPATTLKPLPQLITALLDRFPDLQIETRQEAQTLPAGVEEGRFDLVLVYFEGADTHGDLLRVKVFEDRQIVAVRPTHSLATVRGEAPLSELLKHPWASWGLTPSFQRWVGELTAAQAQRVSAFTSDSFPVIIEVAKRADYIVRGPFFLFEEALATGALVEIETSYAATYECWMLTTAEQWRSPLIKAVAAIAKSVC